MEGLAHQEQVTQLEVLFDQDFRAWYAGDLATTIEGLPQGKELMWGILDNSVFHALMQRAEAAHSTFDAYINSLDESNKNLLQTELRTIVANFLEHGKTGIDAIDNSQIPQTA